MKYYSIVMLFLQAGLVLLKVAGMTTLSWGWVLTPIWGNILGLVFLTSLLGTIGGVVYLVEHSDKNKKS